MKLRIDIPNSFAVSSYADHKLAKEVYTQIIAAAVRIGMEIDISRAELFDDDVVEALTTGEIRYAYHAHELGNNVFNIKASAIPSLWYFDTSGYSGWSEIAQRPDLQDQGKTYNAAKAQEIISKYRDGFLRRNLSKVTQSDAPLDKQIENLDGFVFFPLQVEGDRVLAHLPWTQIEALERVAQLASSTGKSVVIKKHPLCISDAVSQTVARLVTRDRVYVTDKSVHKLISACDAVLVSNSGVGLEALIHGKPVYTMAASEYRHMTKPVMSLNELNGVFTDEPVAMSQEAQCQLGYLLDDYLVDVSSAEAVEARLRRHVDLHNSDHVIESEAYSPAASLALKSVKLFERTKKQLADAVELLLRADVFEIDMASEERADILSRAVRLNVKRDVILREASPDILISAARMLLKTKELEAAQVFAETAAKDGFEGRALYMQALIAGAHQQADVSMRCLTASATFSDATDNTYLLLAQTLFKLGEAHYAASEDAARKALSINPERAIAYLHLARLAHTRGDISATTALFEQARQRYPNNAAVMRFSKMLEVP